MTEFKDRNPDSISEILESIRAVWMRHPGWRLGQLIVAATDPPDACPTIFGMGDDTLVRCVQSFGRNLDDLRGQPHS